LRLGVAVLDPVAHLTYHSIQSASAGDPRGGLGILVIQSFSTSMSSHYVNTGLLLTCTKSCGLSPLPPLT
jgi:hypothetical protein